MSSSDFSNSSRRHTYDFGSPTEDTPEVLNLDGAEDEDEIQQELNRRAEPLPGASFPQAIARFYRFYWLNRGSASGSEFAWGMLWGIGTVVISFALTLWMGDVVQTGGDSVSSLFRVLYMLMVYVSPGLLLVHLGPVFSLLTRFRNGRKQASS